MLGTYFCPKFFGIFLLFYRNFKNYLVKIWLNIGIFGQNKIGLVFGFCGCHFTGIGLLSVCHFPENAISSYDDKGYLSAHQYLAARDFAPTKYSKFQPPPLTFSFANFQS